MIFIATYDQYMQGHFRGSAHYSELNYPGELEGLVGF